MQTRSVFCVNENSVSVGFALCTNAGLTVPDSSVDCFEDPCPGEIVYRYAVTSFSQVSLDLGGGHVWSSGKMQDS